MIGDNKTVAPANIKGEKAKLLTNYNQILNVILKIKSLEIIVKMLIPSFFLIIMDFFSCYKV